MVTRVSDFQDLRKITTDLTFATNNRNLLKNPLKNPWKGTEQNTAKYEGFITKGEESNTCVVSVAVLD